ncbi:Las1-like-domain-containing protein [Limtongia smithiae]|uniref:Las1-like-domain-containing protein n=1 Tax=Limtongia smithiae TaxID=1125753 RepID=UPI0034CDC097
MSRHPRQLPYRDLAELEELYAWLYPDFDELSYPDAAAVTEAECAAWRNALRRVHAYQIRGHVPYAIEASAALISACLIDASSISALSRRLAYASALVRFVNGFLDAHQKSQYARALHLLALQVGMPTSFVELRHACTHENLPRLDVLERGARDALQWIRERYWIPELQRLREARLLDPTKFITRVEELVKAYKTGRKFAARENNDGDGEGEGRREYSDNSEVCDENSDSEEGSSTARGKVWDDDHLDAPLFKSTNTAPIPRAYWRALRELVSLAKLHPDLCETVGIEELWRSRQKFQMRAVDSVACLSPALQRMGRSAVHAMLRRCLHVISDAQHNSRSKRLHALKFNGEKHFEDLPLAKAWTRHIIFHIRSPHTSHLYIPSQDCDANGASPGFQFVFSQFAKDCVAAGQPSYPVYRLLERAFYNVKELSTTYDDRKSEYSSSLPKPPRDLPQFGPKYPRDSTEGLEEERDELEDLVFVNTYRSQVELLNSGWLLPMVNTPQVLQSISTESASMQDVEDMREPPPAPSAVAHAPRVTSWDTLSGEWTPRPFGYLVAK